jgi:apurinic endonuclease APN1
MKKAGFHLRPQIPLKKVFDQAKELGLKCFQTFVINDQRLLDLDLTDIKICHLATNEIELYVHGSYWICPTLNDHRSFKSFKTEYELALALGAKYFVIHLGSGKRYKSKDIAIEQSARFLNEITKNITQPECQILLENTAHQNYTIGSELNDFNKLYQILDKSDKIGFCLDTAHAHAYGYDIVETKEQNKFVENFKNINFILKLLHLNDTNELKGSFIDKHEIAGQGKIGWQALQNLVKLIANDIPLILETPTEIFNNLNKKKINEILGKFE